MQRFIITLLTIIILTSPTNADALNIVFILADDMGYGDIQALNADSQIPTPNLNQLAKEGMTFTDGHSPSAVCTPTRYATLTGRYCWRSRLTRGVLGGYSKPLIEKNRVTVATFLQQAGYQTGAVGKWHLGMDLPLLTDNADTQRWDGDPGIDFAGQITDSPIHHGFDYYFGVSASLDMAPYVYIRNDRFTMKPTIQQPAVKFPHFVRQGPRAEDFEIDDVLDKLTEEAVAFIKRSANNKDKPFFLYMPLTGPHKPAQPHERFRGKTNLGEYGDFVHQVDWTVGEVLNTIDDAGVSDTTLVIFSSDNGSYMYSVDDDAAEDHVDDPTRQSYRRKNHRANGVFRGTKADIYEAGHHVPLLARWPGKIMSGSRCNETVCLTDLFATFADIVNVRIPDGAAEDSYSLFPMMQGNESAKRGAPVIHHSINGMFAIRAGKWKLIAGNGSGGREKPAGRPFERPFQLFDMAADIGEQHNVANEHQNQLAQLTERLDAIRQEGDARK